MPLRSRTVLIQIQIEFILHQKSDETIKLSDMKYLQLEVEFFNLYI